MTSSLPFIDNEFLLSIIIDFLDLVLVLKIFQENLVIFAGKSNDYYEKIK